MAEYLLIVQIHTHLNDCTNIKLRLPQKCGSLFKYKNFMRKLNLLRHRMTIKECLTRSTNKMLVMTICVLCLQSCKMGNKPNLSGYIPFSEDEFRSSEKLFGNKITELKLENPRNIYVIDSLIITVDRNTDYLLHVYNIKTGEKINELIRRGKGPFELLSVDYIQKQDQEKRILVFGTVEKKVVEFSFSDLQKRTSDIVFTEFFIKDQGCLRVIRNRDDYVGLTLRDSIVNRLYIYNKDGIMVNAVGNYPSLVPMVGNMLDATLFEAFHQILADGTMVLSYRNMDLIEIYDRQYKIKRKFFGPNGVLPSYKLKSKGTFKWIGFNEDQIETFGEIIPNPMNNEFWVSYSGRKVNDQGYLWSKIFVFDANGSFIKKYELNIPVFKMDVNFRSRKIYAVTYPDIAVYEFKY